MFAIFWKRLMTGLIVSKNSVLLTHNFADIISCRIAANFQFPKPSSNDVHYAILKILKFGGVQKVLFDLRCFWISTRIWLSKLWLCEFAWCTNENREMYLVIFMIIFSCISSSLNHELEDVRADSDCLPRRAWTGPRCLPDCLAWSTLPVDSDPLALAGSKQAYYLSACAWFGLGSCEARISLWSTGGTRPGSATASSLSQVRDMNHCQ